MFPGAQKACVSVKKHSPWNVKLKTGYSSGNSWDSGEKIRSSGGTKARQASSPHLAVFRLVGTSVSPGLQYP